MCLSGVLTTRLCLVLIRKSQAYRRYGEAEWVISKHSAVAGCVLEDEYKYEWMLLLPPALYQLPCSFVSESNLFIFLLHFGHQSAAHANSSGQGMKRGCVGGRMEGRQAVGRRTATATTSGFTNYSEGEWLLSMNFDDRRRQMRQPPDR